MRRWKAAISPRRCRRALREFSPPVLDAARTGRRNWLPSQLNAALVFGNERFGLPNEVVEKCNVLINIPANPDYSSLNLAQAVQVLAYECRMAAAGDALPTAAASVFTAMRPACAQIEGMYAHLEQALVAIDFLDAGQSEKTDAAPEAPVCPHSAGNRGSQYPARHRPADIVEIARRKQMRRAHQFSWLLVRHRFDKRETA